MNPIRRIRRIAGALAFACLVLAVAAPAAFARVVPPSGSGGVTTPAPPPAQVHTVIVGGMAGWQIALIAVGAALVAATMAVLLDRARTAHLKPLTEAA
jgi:Na+/proline symporter